MAKYSFEFKRMIRTGVYKWPKGYIIKSAFELYK